MSMLHYMVAPVALLTMILAAAGIWSILCRLRLMHPARTKLVVAAQHGVLALGLFCAAVWSFNWELAREFGARGWVLDLLENRDIGTMALAASVLLYLLMSAHRWRFTAPAGTYHDDSE